MKKIKKNIIYFSLLVLILGCANKTTTINSTTYIKAEDVSIIKKTLIDGFNKYDSTLIKYNYVGNLPIGSRYSDYLAQEKLENSYYDAIINGYTIKWLYSDLLRHSTCLIRNTNGKYFYFSNSDIYRYKKVFDYSIHYKNGNLGLKDCDTLFVFQDSASVDVKYFQDIIEQESNIKTNEEKICLFEKLFYNLYKLTFLSDIKTKINRVSIHSDVYLWELEKLYKKETGINTQNLNRIIDQVYKLKNRYFQTTYIFVDNFGIIILCFDQKGNALNMKKYFIPQLEIGHVFKL